MGWQDAPAVDDSNTAAWAKAPAVDAKPAPTVQDAQASQLRRQVMGGLPFIGAMAPDALFGARQVVEKLAQLVTNNADPVKQFVNDDKAQYEKDYQPDAQPGAGLARGVGQALMTAPLAVPAKAGALVGGAANGAIAGALEPVYGDANVYSETAKQAGAGAVAGLGMGAAAKVAGKVIGGATPSPAAQTLLGADVTLTPGQVAGGMAKTTEDKLTSFPLIGDLIQQRRFQGITDFNRAVYARAVEPLSQFDPAAADVAAKADVGRNGIAKVGDYLSAKYEQALDQSAPAPLTAEAQQALNNLADMVPASKQMDFLKAIKRTVLDNVTPAGTLTPSVAKDADSELGRLARGYAGSQDFEQRELAGALREAQSTLREMFADANPDTAPIIRAADQGWATLTQMERAGSMLGAKDGIFTPAQFLNAVKRGDTSIRDRRFARGEMLNQDLGEAGEAVLPNKVPDSGTTGRLLVNAGAAGGLHSIGALLDPHTLATVGAASLPYLPVVGPAVTSLAMLARPQIAQDAGGLLARLAPYTSLLAGARGP